MGGNRGGRCKCKVQKAQEKDPVAYDTCRLRRWRSLNTLKQNGQTEAAGRVESGCASWCFKRRCPTRPARERQALPHSGHEKTAGSTRGG
eukprot:12908385-Prorocentrum_lima.AAC.1